jgi:RHS repeat-associated protein
MTGWWQTTFVNLYVDLASNALTIDRQGTGTGGISASGLTCPGGTTTQALPCGASYPLHTVVTLTPVPDPDSTFTGWSGACSGTGGCQVTMSGARLVAATFAKTPGTITTTYYHTDVVGSVRALTDQTGAVVLRHDYLPFGEDSQSMFGDPMRFAGKHLDPETALHYFEARYYRQTWGRFSQVDPLHVGAATTDPQQWNRYAYARNNPLAWGDPSGMETNATFRTGVDMCEYGGTYPNCVPMELSLTDIGYCWRNSPAGYCEFVDFENLDSLFPGSGGYNCCSESPIETGGGLQAPGTNPSPNPNRDPGPNPDPAAADDEQDNPEGRASVVACAAEFGRAYSLQSLFGADNWFGDVFLSNDFTSVYDFAKGFGTGKVVQIAGRYAGRIPTGLSHSDYLLPRTMRVEDDVFRTGRSATVAEVALGRTVGAAFNRFNVLKTTYDALTVGVGLVACGVAK